VRALSATLHLRSNLRFTTAGRRHQKPERRLEQGPGRSFEINEAFAVVTLAAMRDLQIPHEKVNIHGGARSVTPSALPGAHHRHALERSRRAGKARRRGAAIGGGEATAMAVGASYDGPANRPV
jgi:hypothetical protein